MAAPTNTQFAVATHVLTLLAGLREEPVSSELMAGSVGASPVYLRRVLGRLREAGLVDSRPGPRGGWRLLREPSEITLGDAWRAVRDHDAVFGLHAVQPGCPVGAQVAATLGALDQRLATGVEQELDRTTVADVMPAATFTAASLSALG